AHRPEFVVRTGDLPTSKPLRAWLAGLDAAQIAIDPDGAWHDPAGVVGWRVHAPIRALLEGLTAGEVIASEPAWLESWRTADDAVASTIVEVLGDELSEPAVARGLGQWLQDGTTLFVASSMPIRD